VTCDLSALSSLGLFPESTNSEVANEISKLPSDCSSLLDFSFYTSRSQPQHRPPRSRTPAHTSALLPPKRSTRSRPTLIPIALNHTQKQNMAPLLKSLYRPSQRSLLSSLFTATFLGAVVVVAFPCPVRPTNLSGRAEAMLDSETTGTIGRRRREDGEVVVLMNQRGRRFMEER
jgi:hypothetical protein